MLLLLLLLVQAASAAPPYAFNATRARQMVQYSFAAYCSPAAIHD